MFTIRAKVLLALLALVSVLGASLSAEHPSDGQEPARVDRHGDPLPAGAVARLGTLRLRRADQSSASLAFLPDGKTLVSARTAKVAQFWDVKTGKPLTELRQDKRFNTFALSWTGKVLVTAGEDTIIAWDVPARKQLCSIEAERVYKSGLAIAPDDRSLAYVGKGNSVRVCDVQTGKEKRQFTGDVGEVNSLSFTLDGKMLLSGGNLGIRVREIETGREVRRFDAGLFNYLALSPDGATLASGGRQPVENVLRARLILWDVATGKKLREIHGHKQFVEGVVFSPDGKTLASSELETIYLWDVSTGRELRRIDKAGYCGMRLAFSPDGKTLASATPSTETVVRLWDVATGKPLQPGGHEGTVRTVAFSPDGKLVATGAWLGYDFSIRLWDASTGALLKTFEGHKSYIQKILFTPDGKGVIAGSNDGMVYLWDVQTGKSKRTFSNRENGGYALLGMALSTDGKTLASISYPSDGTMKPLVILWDVATGKPSLKWQSQDPQFPNIIAFSTDGEITAIPEGKGLPLREVASGQVLLSLESAPLQPRERLLEVVAFSPDGRAVAAVTGTPLPGGRYDELADCTIHLWELATGRTIRRIQGIKNAVQAAAFSPDGRTLATAGEGLVQLWDIATGKELLAYRGQDVQVSLGAVAFSPDGTKLVAGYWDSTAIVWDLTPGIRRARMAPKTLTPGDLQRLWTNLAGQDPAEAHVAVWDLVATPREALPLLRERLKPVERIDPQHIGRLLTGLDHSKFAVREAAAKELEQIVDQAELLLREKLEGKPTLEVRRRIEGILLSSRLARSPEGLRRLRSIQVLEQLGTPEAQQILERLAKGAPAARGTRDAKAALLWLAGRSPRPAGKAQ